ncbi:PREDICTED: uncharacterized protein LOC106125641 [Papilio xuthus]|uniref:Uncharacterized protein LOC106125641 n=1 Tax=Papilio xuthus TaxID=66420 RepID=A0AAJ7EI90_PAPXU|nr:PREDICTED: uncharacterized protein LOC106125641 [Papilio xuthus]
MGDEAPEPRQHGPAACRTRPCLISGSLPWDLEAGVLVEVYRRRALMRQREPLPEEIVRWSKEGRDDLFRRWQERLADASVSSRLIEAVRPVLRQWVGGARHQEPTYFLTQLLTGHGCFSRYLCEVVGIESGPECHHCASGDVDTAEHTRSPCARAGTRNAPHSLAQ